MTFNAKHRWVLPLAPTACAYSKLNGYFGKLRGLEIEVLQARGDFGGNVSVRGVLRAKKKRPRRKMRSSKSAILEMGDMIRDTIFRSVSTISGCSGVAENMGNLREIEKCAI